MACERPVPIDPSLTQAMAHLPRRSMDAVKVSSGSERSGVGCGMWRGRAEHKNQGPCEFIVKFSLDWDQFATRSRCPHPQVVRSCKHASLLPLSQHESACVGSESSSNCWNIAEAAAAVDPRITKSWQYQATRNVAAAAVLHDLKAEHLHSGEGGGH